MTEIRFGEIAAAARLRLPDLVRRWLPDGRACGREYVPRNPTRNDRRLGSFKINLATGRWADFATGAKGGDAIALLAYLDGSDQARATRVQGFAREYGDTEAFHYIGQSVNFTADAEAVADVAQAAKALGAKLIVVDTLARAIAEGDEITPGDMGRLIATLDALRAATGAHVMVVHHTGKDESRGMRGHSSLNGAADVTLHVTASGAARQAEVKKNKDGLAGTTLAFALKPTTLGRDDDGDDIVTMVVEEVQGAAPKAPAKRERLAAEQRMIFEEIQSFFADIEPDFVTPAPGMRRRARRTIRRCRRRGRWIGGERWVTRRVAEPDWRSAAAPQSGEVRWSCVK